MVQIELVASANPRRLLCPATLAKSILEKSRERIVPDEAGTVIASPNPCSGSTGFRSTRGLRAPAPIRSLSAPRA